MEQGFLDALTDMSTIDDTRELVDWIRELVADGENLNIQDINGSTYLMLHIRGREPNIEIVNALIEGGVNVNSQDSGGTTALMYSSIYTDVEIMNALIEAGADVNLQNIRGDTALIYAVYNTNYLEIVNALIKAGADVNLENDKGKTALDIAIAQGNQEIIDILTKAENKAKKRIAIDAYMRSRDKPYLPPNAENPLSGFYHSKIDEPDYIMEKVFNMAYGEDEKENENEGAEESKRSDSGGRRKKLRRKSKSKKRKSGGRKKSVAKKKKSRSRKSGVRKKKSRSKRRKSVRK